MFLQETGLDVVLHILIIFYLFLLGLKLFIKALTFDGSSHIRLKGEPEHNKTQDYDGYFLTGGYETLTTDSPSEAIRHFKREASRRGTSCTGIYCEGKLIAGMKELN